MARSSIALVAACAGGLIVLGCGSDPSPPPSAPQSAARSPASAPQAAAPRGEDTATPTSGSVHIERKIVEACGNLPTPHFAFDSANVRAPAQEALDALADCFTKGPLKGKELKLVGHADPRGDIDYNLGLGHKRAGSVAEFLAKQGLEKERVETTSRGELDATGVDEEGWAKDRKVEIVLDE